MKKKNLARARAVILTAVLLLTILTIISPTVAAKPPKPAVHFAIQAASHMGGWVTGTIYEDDTATGSGSICNLDFRVEFPDPPLEAHGLVWQVTVTAASWDGDKLMVTIDLYSPKLDFQIIGLPEEISGLDEGHNELFIFGSKHIIQIHTMP